MDDTQNQGEELPVTDAEIVENEEGEVTPVNGDATVLTSLDELIKNHVKSIDSLRFEIKKQQEMITDGFANDPVYRENDAKAKEAAKVKNTTKLQIMKQPAMMTLSNKVKSMKAELKDKQFALSDYLLEYQRLSGVNQIETDDGQVLEIVNVAKVVRKSSK